jgi:hypothetical protein
VSLSPGTLRSPEVDGDGPLFVHEARRNGIVVAALTGAWRPDGGVIVEATVTPIGQAPGDTVTRPFAFTTSEQAARFVDEALLALEYLDCEIVDQ